MQPARLHAASQIACSQPALNSAFLVQQAFEQLNPEMLSFPTRPQPPAESNPEMKSTVRRSIYLKNGYPAL
jgi:hypothetical protein